MTAKEATVANQSPRSSQLWAFLVVLAVVAITYGLFPGGFPLIPAQKWDLKEVTIMGFRAGASREQIEARLGPMRQLEKQSWIWTPPPAPAPSTGDFPQVTFEMLSLHKSGQRWYLSGSQFEYRGQKFVTQIHCADSIWQGTVQRHFGAGEFDSLGNDISLTYRDSSPGGIELSFGINHDEFGPKSTRAVVFTTINWPEVAAR